MVASRCGNDGSNLSVFEHLVKVTYTVLRRVGNEAPPIHRMAPKPDSKSQGLEMLDARTNAVGKRAGASPRGTHDADDITPP